MKYMGSKNRLAKFLIPIMLANRCGRTWVEPFVGGANIIDKIDGHRIGADLNKYIISLLIEMTKPDFKAPKINEDNYNDIKKNPNNYMDWVVGYAATQLSYGSKWFGGYRRDSVGIRNYCKEAQNNINKQSKYIKNVKFIHCNYLDLIIPKNCIIYCDPPYKNTTKYNFKFNYDEFWQWCRDKTNEGHQVFISEYNAPDDFMCIWEKKVNSSLTKNTGSKKAIEKLFVYNKK